MRLQLMFVLFLFTALRLEAQHYAVQNFDHYTTANGLTNNIVTSITQDSVGYIWISTANGVNRYNGSRFVQFHSTSDSLSLPTEGIAGMSWISKHQLAMFPSGVHIMDTKTGETYNIFIPYHNKQYQYKFNMIERVTGDADGNIYVLTRSGFYHYNKDRKLVFRYDYFKDEDIPTTHIFYGRDVWELDANRLFVVAIDGLHVYDKSKRQLKKMKAGDCPVLDDMLDYPSVHYIFFQPKPGHLFAFKARSDSVFYIDVARNKKVLSKAPFNPLIDEINYRSRMHRVNDTTFYITGHVSGFFKMHFNPRSGALSLDRDKYFSNYLCNAVFTDNDNHLWVATNKGVFRQNPQRSMVEVADIPPGMEDQYPNITFDDVTVTSDKIYVGTRAKGGLLVYDKKTLKFEDQIRFANYPGDRGNTIYVNRPINDSVLLLGTDGPLLLVNRFTKKSKQIKPEKWHPGDWVFDILPSRKGEYWIGAFYIHRYNYATNSFKSIPTFRQMHSTPVAIAEDTSGNIWFAGHGIGRYNIAKDTMDMVLDSFPSLKMPDKQVGAIIVDKYNRLWFNSHNNGLLAYDINKKTFLNFTRKDGLPDDNLASTFILGDHLWIACISEIACLDLRTLKIVSFGKEDGFPDMPIMHGARFTYDSSTQQMYIAFSTSVVRFHPYEILRRKSPPHMFIENLSISGQKNQFLPNASISTSWKQNEIRLTIGTINFYDGPSQRFAYRIMKDSASPWVLMGSQPSVSISSLAPGTHRIQLKTFSPANRWAEQVKEMSIIVRPPFWQTWWFITLLSLAGVVMVYLLIKWRTGLVRKKEMVKTHIEKLKADDYKNQFELQQISNYFSSSLAGKTSEDEVLWDVAQNLIGHMNYEDCIIYVWNKDKTKMIQKAAYGPKGKPETISSQLFDVLPGQGIVGYVIETRQPVLVGDTRLDKRYRVDDQFRLSEVCVPIIHNDELLGVIDSEHTLPNYFSERDIKILTTIATLIGNKLKQLESERSLVTINEQLAEARLSALQAQMNPHFVFNALNSIKRMILEGDNDKASRYLSKFALMIRMTLNHSKEIFVTLDENIEYLRAYVEMEQLRFDDSFTYSIKTENNIETAETAIPSMMMQPIVENAIWHGLMHSGNPKKIQIGFTQNDSRLTCTVEDNGIGIRLSEKLKQISRPPHHSVGLENLRHRIKIMNEKYDMNCVLKLEDLKENGEGNGTRVTLTFNVLNT